MRGGARQGTRRWTAAVTPVVTLTVIVVCLSSFSAWSQERTGGVSSASTAPVVQPGPLPTDTVEIHLRKMAEALRELRENGVFEIEIPEITLPGMPRVVIVRDGSDSAFVQDSIYATEITADAGGVEIVDRDGRHLRVIGLPLSTDIRISPRPHITGQREDIFHMFSDVITIEEDEVINGDVISIFGGRVVVLGHVNGSVASIFGTIDVEGTVEEAAIAPFGSVHIGPSGKVGTNVVASEISKEPGARIGGIRNELFFKIFGQDWQPDGQMWLRRTFTVVAVVKLLFWVFLVLLAHAVAAKNIAKVKARIASAFFKSFFMGVLVQIMLIPAVLLLLVTIIGIPVAIFLVPLMLVGALVLAFAAAGLFIGEKINQNTTLPLPSALAQTVVGTIVLQSIPLMAVASLWLAQAEAAAPLFRIVTFVLIALTMLVTYVVVTLGMGAVMMTRFGTRPKDPDGSVSPAPTPLPGDRDAQSPERTPSPLPQPRPEEPGTATAS